MTSQPVDNRITFYGTVWCGDCRRTKAYLDSHQIPYQFVDIDRDPSAESFVKQINRGRRSVPTLIAPDGSRVVEPSETQLASWIAEHFSNN